MKKLIFEQKIAVIFFSAVLTVNILFLFIHFFFPVGEYSGEYSVKLKNDIAVVNEKDVCAVSTNGKTINVTDSSKNIRYSFERVSLFKIKESGSDQYLKCNNAIVVQIYMGFLYLCSALVFALSPYNRKTTAQLFS